MGIWLEHLNWIEAQEVLKSSRTVIIPIGARLKEHAYHLPLNNDWIMAEYFAKRIADKIDAIILPTIQFGYYPAFVDYPGSINIEEETWIKYLLDITLSLSKHGAKKFYFLNTGISTISPLEKLKDLLDKQNIKMDFTDYRFLGLVAEDSVREQSAGTHADEIETSMMQYIEPSVVKMEKAVCDISGPRQKGRLSPIPNIPNTHYSPTGAWGDPTKASIEKGKLVVEAQVEELLAYLNDF